MMPDYSHEEVDMRVAVHILHALEQIKLFVMQTIDIDVIVILAGV